LLGVVPVQYHTDRLITHSTGNISWVSSNNYTNDWVSAIYLHLCIRLQYW